MMTPRKFYYPTRQSQHTMSSVRLLLFAIVLVLVSFLAACTPLDDGTADTTAPVLVERSCPDDFTRNIGGLGSPVITWTEPTYSDDDPNLTIVASDDDGTTPLVDADPDLAGFQYPVSATDVDAPITITYTATDTSGNSNLGSGNEDTGCSFTITITDIQDSSPPEIVNCPAGTLDFSVAMDGDQTAIASWANIIGMDVTSPPVTVELISTFAVTDDMSTSDNLNDDTVNDATNLLLANGDAFPVGTTQVTYMATDFVGVPSEECVFNVRVSGIVDSTPPTLDQNSCPSDITTGTDIRDGDIATVTWIPPTYSDVINSPSQLTIVGSDGANDVPAPDPVSGMVSYTASLSGPPITITYTAEDTSENLNANSCSFTITVTQRTMPTVECPVDIDVVTDTPTDTGADVRWDTPITSITADDAGFTLSAPMIVFEDSASPVVAGDETGLFIVPVGINSIRYEISNSNGVVDSCTFTVTVERAMDATPPMFDNCPTDTGITEIIDMAGDDAEISWTLTVTEDVDPSVTVMSTVTGDAVPDSPVDLGSIMTTTTDNTVTFMYTLSNVQAETTVMVANMATNAANLVGACAFSAAVEIGEDSEQPTLDPGTCPTMMTVDTDTVTGSTAIVTWIPPTYDDNVNSPMQLMVTATDMSGGPPLEDADPDTDNFQYEASRGTTTITYTATDTSSNPNMECSFDITVNQAVDMTAPVFEDCPTDTGITVTIGAAGEDATISWTLTVTEDVDTTVTVMSIVTGADVPAGSVDLTPMTTTADDNTVTFMYTLNSVQADTTVMVTNTATNIATLVETCEFSATVEITVDDMPPTLDTGSCPLMIIAETDTATGPNSNMATVTWNPPTYSDLVNSPTQIVVTASDSVTTPLVDADPDTDDFQYIASLGPTTITYTATDTSSNSNTDCSFDIMVTQKVDNINPTVACPSAITRSTGATDNPGTSVSVTWAVATVTDNELPAPTLNPPTAAFSAANGADIPAAQNGMVTYDAPVGETRVTYTASDASMNVGMCSFLITITDGTNPTIDCPAAQSVDVASSATAPYQVMLSSPTTNDNVGVTVVRITIGNGASMATNANGTYEFQNLGATTVTYTASDAIGNSDSCTFTVTVAVEVIDEAPVLAPYSCPNDIVQGVTLTVFSKSITWMAPTYTDVVDDNAGTPLTITVTATQHGVTSDLATNIGTTANPYAALVGLTTIVYTATDSAGNTNSLCNFTVTISQSTSGALGEGAIFLVPGTCPEDIVTTVASSSDTVSVTWIAPRYSSISNGQLVEVVNSGHLTIGAVPPSQTFDPMGETSQADTIFDSDNGDGRPAMHGTVALDPPYEAAFGTTTIIYERISSNGGARDRSCTFEIRVVLEANRPPEEPEPPTPPTFEFPRASATVSAAERGGALISENNQFSCREEEWGFSDFTCDKNYAIDFRPYGPVTGALMTAYERVEIEIIHGTYQENDASNPGQVQKCNSGDERYVQDLCPISIIATDELQRSRARPLRKNTSSIELMRYMPNYGIASGTDAALRTLREDITHLWPYLQGKEIFLSLNNATSGALNTGAVAKIDGLRIILTPYTTLPSRGTELPYRVAPAFGNGIHSGEGTFESGNQTDRQFLYENDITRDGSLLGGEMFGRLVVPRVTVTSEDAAAMSKLGVYLYATGRRQYNRVGGPLSLTYHLDTDRTPAGAVELGEARDLYTFNINENVPSSGDTTAYTRTLPADTSIMQPTGRLATNLLPGWRPGQRVPYFMFSADSTKLTSLALNANDELFLNVTTDSTRTFDENNEDNYILMLAGTYVFYRDY